MVKKYCCGYSFSLPGRLPKASVMVYGHRRQTILCRLTTIPDVSLSLIFFFLESNRVPYHDYFLIFLSLWRILFLNLENLYLYFL